MPGRNVMSTPSSAQLVDENRFLNDELNRVETVLNLTRAEKDELSIRYNALSDRVSHRAYIPLSSFFNQLVVPSLTVEDLARVANGI